MDVLRKKKKDEDYFTGEEDIADFGGDVEQDTDAAVEVSSDDAYETSLGEYREKDVKRTKRQKEAEQSKKDRAANIRLWKIILEEYSQHGDIQHENLSQPLIQFSKSFLRPKAASAEKIMRFYRSLVPKNKDEMPTADEELLDLFYEKMTVENIKGLELLQNKFQREERIYNGKESLEVLRDFLQTVSEVRASALTGKGMTRLKLDKLNRLIKLGLKQADFSEGGNLQADDLDMLLQKFRVVILTLSKIKREQKKLFKKADNPSQTRLPKYVQRKINQVKIKDEKKRKEAQQKIARDYWDSITGKKERTPKEQKRVQRIMDSVINRYKTKWDSLSPEEQKKFRKKKDVTGLLRRFNQDAKTYRFDLNVEDRNWEVDETQDETQDESEPTPYDNLDFTRRGTILPDETADQIDYLIDKVEEAYQTVSNLVDTPKEKGIFATAERTKKIMKTLVDEMIGDFKFTINNNEKRAIKIN
tara:strand:- start:282 stop:1703 length:1422 start_codon:yes stop_codon:yes gene_type:complete